MSQSWLQGEARKAVGDAREFLARGLKGPVYLHFRRGELRASGVPNLVGYERATPIRLPLDQSDEDVVSWVVFELKNLPCHP